MQQNYVISLGKILSNYCITSIFFWWTL